MLVALLVVVVVEVEVVIVGVEPVFLRVFYDVSSRQVLITYLLYLIRFEVKEISERGGVGD